MSTAEPSQIPYDDAIVGEILDKLNDDFSVDYLVDNLFKTTDYTNIESILSNVKRNIFQKNECLKQYLSQNQNQLLSCGDLIDTLKLYSNKSFENASKLSQLITSLENLLSPTTPTPFPQVDGLQTPNLQNPNPKPTLNLEIKAQIFFPELLQILPDLLFTSGYYYLSILLLKQYQSSLSSHQNSNLQNYSFSIQNFLQKNLNSQ